MLQIPTYVFPSGSADEIIQRATDHLAAYLFDPTGADYDGFTDEQKSQAAGYVEAAGVTGLATGPTFVIRPGTGIPGDEPVTAPAAILYRDDDRPGVPFVRLIVEALGNVEDWADRVIQPIAFTVDHYADEWQGILTSGQNANDATASLQGATWQLLTPSSKVYPLLKTWGFCNPGTRAGAPIREGIELTAPYTFGFDLYHYQ